MTPERERASPRTAAGASCDANAKQPFQIGYDAKLQRTQDRR